MANLPPLPGRAHYPGSGNPPGHAHPKGHDAHIAGRSHLSGNTLIPGRAQPINPNPAPHVVLGTSVLADPAPGEELIYLAMGCFWGAEKLMWELGASVTAVGYMGGDTPNPTYGEVCTGLTGHAETVRVVFDPHTLPLEKIVQAFFESHDPTTLNRQGNDVGTQYRSALFTTTVQQLQLATHMRDMYQAELEVAGRGTIVTQIELANEAGPFYLAEEVHQGYLHKVPHGYQCHARTGIACPLPQRRY